MCYNHYMKFNVSIHAQDVMAARDILEEWVQSAVDDPSTKIDINKQEVHCFITITEHDSRCLKVVVNPIKRLVITAYFDRKMKKKGC